MEGAARLLLEAGEHVTASSGAASAAVKSALEVSAQSVPKEEANAIRIATAAVTDENALKRQKVSAILRALISNAGDERIATTATRLDTSVLGKNGANLLLQSQERFADALTAEELKSLREISNATAASRFPDAAVNSVDRFLRSEGHSLIDSLDTPLARTLLNDTRFSQIAASSSADASSVAVEQRVVENILRDVSVKEPKFSRVLSGIYKAAKVSVAGGAAAYCGVWVTNYMKRNSGPFVTRAAASTDGAFSGRRNYLPGNASQHALFLRDELGNAVKRARIADPYPCGFRDKSGSETHPLDVYIRRHVHDPCADWRSWDLCGGWASSITLPGNRLSRVLSANELHEAYQVLNGAKLSCEDTTLKEGLVALVHDAGHTVGSLIRASAYGTVEGLGINFNTLKRICCVAVGIVGGCFVYKGVIRAGTFSPLIAIVVSVLASVVFIVAAFVLCFSKPKPFDYRHRRVITSSSSSL